MVKNVETNTATVTVMDYEDYKGKLLKYVKIEVKGQRVDINIGEKTANNLRDILREEATKKGYDVEKDNKLNEKPNNKK